MMNRKRPGEDEDNEQALKDGWGGWRGYMETKRSKLQKQQQEVSSAVPGAPAIELTDGTVTVQQPQLMFKGIAIYVDGFTVPSADELKRMVLAHGGSYQHYLDARTTTHIVATCLPNGKLKNLRTQNVVRADWIVDSIRAGKLLPHQNYRLYESTQKVLKFRSVEDDVYVVVPSNANVAAKSSDNNPSLLREYYGRSRLHQISTMGMEFRQYVDRLRETTRPLFLGRDRLRKWMTSARGEIGSSDFHSKLDRCIMHIDMDCFFVSVGLRNRPDLQHKPVAVTHSRAGAATNDPSTSCASTSEIACCNYVARRAGVRNGAWLGDAMQLCPDLVTIPYTFEGYKEVAQKLYSIVASYTLDIEAVSCDEMYVDCTRLLAETNATPDQFASCIRNNVYEDTKCTCSAGIASNFLLARIATKRAKPNGQLIVWRHMECDLISKEHVGNLPGIGSSLEKRLLALSVSKCGDLQKIALSRLKHDFGPKLGQTLYNMCRGIDNRVIMKNRMRHSVSAEINYGIRLTEFSELQMLLKEVAEEVQTRLRKLSTKGKTITLKMKVRKPEAPVETVKFMGHGACDSLARGTTLSREVDDAVSIAFECEKLFRNGNVIISDLRGIGIQVSQLSTKDSIPACNTLNRFLVSSERTVTSTDTTHTQGRETSLYQHAGHTDSRILTGGSVQYSSVSLSKCFASPLKPLNAKRQSPNKSTPPKKVPFKYLAMDKHFNASPQKQTHSVPFQAAPAMTTNAHHMVCNVSAHSSEESPKRVLCAAMPFEEMASLFKEWIDTFESPAKDDLDIVRECIQSAIYDRELDKVDSVFRTLRRLVSRKRFSMAWQAAYNSLVRRTQDVVIEVYGGKLATLHPF